MDSKDLTGIGIYNHLLLFNSVSIIIINIIVIIINIIIIIIIRYLQ